MLIIHGILLCLVWTLIDVIIVIYLYVNGPYFPESHIFKKHVNLSPKSFILSWSVSSRNKYPCLTALWTSKQRPKQVSSTRSDRISWAKPCGRKAQHMHVLTRLKHTVTFRRIHITLAMRSLDTSAGKTNEMCLKYIPRDRLHDAEVKHPQVFVYSTQI